MRILIVANKMPYPPKDGGSIATYTLATALQKVGCEVDILAMNTSKHFFNIKNIPSEITSKIRFISVNVNTEIAPLKALRNLLFSSMPYNAERFFTAEFNEQLISVLTNNNYDVVQLEGLYLCPYIETIRKYSKAKIAFRSHNIEHEIWLRAAKNENNILKKFYKQILAKRIRKFKLRYINTYDYLVSITQRDADRFNEFGNTKPVIVTPTGIDEGNPLLKIDNSNAKFPGLFHIGALDWMPNREGLTWFIHDVWKKFHKKDPDIKFYVAGRNAPEDFVKYLEEHDVTYLGEVESALDFYSKGSIFIVPLLSGSGMRIKIIEGMAAAKTILTTPIGTEGIDSTNFENIIIAEKSDEFLKQLENICNNFEMHQHISNNARNFVIENYNNTTIASKLVQFYTENAEC